MFIIEKEKTSKLVIERSRFFGFCFCCESLQQQNKILKKIKADYASATHVCYGSCLLNGNENNYYSSDDREPSGTAGLQIVNKLKEYNLVNTLCVVVRFFGGVKLGVPNLSKAYKQCCEEVLKENTKEVKLKTKCNFICNYNEYDKIKNVLETIDVKPQEVKYENDVLFFCYMSKEEQKVVYNKNIDFSIDKANTKLC